MIVALFGGIFKLFSLKLDNTSDKLDQQISLTNALQDTLRKTNNYLGEEKASKLTLQASLDKLQDQNLNLNDNQKELVSRIKRIQKENQIISAALVRTEVRLDSALDFITAEVNLKDSSLVFPLTSDSISFNIQVNDALPAKKYIKPKLSINSLSIPNKQFIEFHFDDKNEYHQRPVSFSITNSNPLITTTDVESYIIPEVNQEAIKPTGWEKVKHFFKKRKKEIIIFTIGGGVGYLLGTN
ncbi:MAG: hypothetical protein ACOC33_01045 [bacterium]